MIDWLVLRLKPRQETIAANNVRAQGVEFYSPRTLVRSGTASNLRPAALFPGYAFARPLGDAWVHLKSTVGVLEVIMSTNETPARLRPEEITYLRAREDSDGFIRTGVAQFRAGDRVRILPDGGALADLVGVIDDSMAGRDRVFVLLGMLGRLTKVAVDVGKIAHEDDS